VDSGRPEPSGRHTTATSICACSELAGSGSGTAHELHPSALLFPADALHLSLDTGHNCVRITLRIPSRMKRVYEQDRSSVRRPFRRLRRYRPAAVYVNRLRERLAPGSQKHAIVFLELLAAVRAGSLWTVVAWFERVGSLGSLRRDSWALAGFVL
jgi:hypothetical protein